MQVELSFIGREDELKVLHGAYRKAVEDGPIVCTILAESGFGKTRLAQEFYRDLVAQYAPQTGRSYWPPALQREKYNLTLNPDLADIAIPTGTEETQAMPFLWWGLRLAPIGQRNSGSLGNALPAALPVLEAHMGHYDRAMSAKDVRQKRLWGDKSTLVDTGISLLDTGVSLVADATTLGIPGLLRSAAVRVQAHRKAGRELNELAELSIEPVATAARGRDALSERVIELLAALCRPSLPEMPVVPVVLLVDDVQWLGEDLGVVSFLGALLLRARAEKWPLLLIQTSWEREWNVSLAAGQMPGALHRPESDLVLPLGPLAGLDALIPAQFGGLTAEQQQAIAAKAEGMPRFLDEMLAWLRQQPRCFEQRALDGQLTAAGLKALLERSFSGFVSERLQETPKEVREALGIASTQGRAFSPLLVERVGALLALNGVKQGLLAGENPYGFVIGAEGGERAEFRLQAYLEAAREDLENLADVTEIETAFFAALAELADHVAQAGVYELDLMIYPPPADGFDPLGWAPRQLAAAAERIRRAVSLRDTLTAGKVGAHLSGLLAAADYRAEVMRPAHLRDLLIVLRQAHDWSGASPRLGYLLADMLKLAEDSAMGDDLAQLRNGPVMVAIYNLLAANTAELEGEGAAAAWRARARALSHALSVALPELAIARRYHAHQLVKSGENFRLRGNLDAARCDLEEAVSVLSALAQAEPTALHRRELLAATAELNGVIGEQDGEGEEVLLALREAEVDSARSLYHDDPSAKSRRSLALALMRLGDTVEAQKGIRAAAELRRQEYALLDEAPASEGDLGARNDRALAQLRLALLAEAEGETARAMAISEEVAEFQREHRRLAAAPNSALDLSYTLRKLAEMHKATGAARTALTLLKEDVASLEALASSMDAVELRHRFADATMKLAVALSDTGEADAAEQHFVKAIAALEDLIAGDESPQLRFDLAQVMILRGRLALKRGDLEDAEVWTNEACHYAGALVTECVDAAADSTMYCHELFLAALSQQQAIQHRAKNPQRVLQILQQKLMVLAQLEQHNSARWLVELALNVTECAGVAGELYPPEEAIGQFDLAIAIMSAVPAGKRSRKFTQTFVRLLYRASQLMEQLSDPSYDRMFDRLEQAQQLLRGIMAAPLERSDVLELLTILDKMRSVAETCDDDDTAQSLWQDILALQAHLPS